MSSTRRRANAGAIVWFDNTNHNIVNASSAGLFPIGVAVTHAAINDATVRVRLNGVAVSAVAGIPRGGRLRSNLVWLWINGLAAEPDISAYQAVVAVGESTFRHGVAWYGCGVHRMALESVIIAMASVIRAVPAAGISVDQVTVDPHTGKITVGPAPGATAAARNSWDEVLNNAADQERTS